MCVCACVCVERLAFTDTIGRKGWSIEELYKLIALLICKGTILRAYVLTYEHTQTQTHSITHIHTHNTHTYTHTHTHTHTRTHVCVWNCVGIPRDLMIVSGLRMMGALSVLGAVGVMSPLIAIMTSDNLYAALEEGTSRTHIQLHVHSIMRLFTYVVCVMVAVWRDRRVGVERGPYERRSTRARRVYEKDIRPQTTQPHQRHGIRYTPHTTTAC